MSKGQYVLAYCQGASYIQEVLNGHPGVCYEMFSLSMVVIYVIPWKVLSW